MLQGGNLQLRSLAFVAMAAAKRTDPELLSHSLSNWLTDRCAALHVISIADDESAGHLIIEDLRLLCGMREWISQLQHPSFG